MFPSERRYGGTHQLVCICCDHLLLMQFQVYSGYYYVLSLIFIGAGVYSLTSHGCISSIRVCCRENASHQDQDDPILVHTNIQAHMGQVDQNKETSDAEDSLSSMDKFI